MDEKDDFGPGILREVKRDELRIKELEARVHELELLGLETTPWERLNHYEGLHQALDRLIAQYLADVYRTNGRSLQGFKLLSNTSLMEILKWNDARIEAAKAEVAKRTNE
jgi:hypothetical protein